MKTKRTYILLLLLSLTTLVSAQAFTPEDDIYYQPSDKNEIVEKKAQERANSEKVQRTLVISSTKEWDVDEYNRRYAPLPVDSLLENQEEEAVTYNISTDEGDGYYLNGFNGSENDYEYAERIRRFHNPKFTIHISDPAYTDIYMLNNNDWNIYIDNSYAWVTPTWSNPRYWDYNWSPYSYASYGWGYGYGRPPYWGGYDPYYGWGYHHHHHHYHYGYRPYRPYYYYYYGYGCGYRPIYHAPKYNYSPNGRSTSGRGTAISSRSSSGRSTSLSSGRSTSSSGRSSSYSSGRSSSRSSNRTTISNGSGSSSSRSSASPDRSTSRSSRSSYNSGSSTTRSSAPSYNSSNSSRSSSRSSSPSYKSSNSSSRSSSSSYNSSSSSSRSSSSHSSSSRSSSSRSSGR